MVSLFFIIIFILLVEINRVRSHLYVCMPVDVVLLFAYVCQNQATNFDVQYITLSRTPTIRSTFLHFCSCVNTPLHSAHIASFCLRNNLWVRALGKFNGYFHLILAPSFRDDNHTFCNAFRLYVCIYRVIQILK